MSAFRDRPRHFVERMRRLPNGETLAAQDFVPRRQFGADIYCLPREEVRPPRTTTAWNCCAAMCAACRGPWLG